MYKHKIDFFWEKFKEEPPVLAASAYFILMSERQVSEEKNGLT